MSKSVSDLSSEQLKLLFEISQEHLYIAKVDGLIQNVNGRFFKKLGYAEIELIDYSYFDLIHPDDLEISKFQLKNIINNKAVNGFENRFKCKGGIYKWFSWNYIYLKHEDLLYASSSDISKQKEAERLNEIFHKVTDGFFTLNKNLEIISFNAKGQSLSKYTKEELLNQKFLHVFEQATHLNMYRNSKFPLNSTIVPPFVAYYPRLKLWLEISTYPQNDSLSIVINDITQFKIQQLNVKLRNKVLKLTLAKNTPVKPVLSLVLKGIENIYPHLVCSVLLLDNIRGSQLLAPSLPLNFIKTYTSSSLEKGKALNGLSVNHYWAIYKKLASKNDLFAYYSFPLVDSLGHVMAVFQVCGKSKTKPSSEEINPIKNITSVLRVFLEYDADKNNSSVSNERYRLATAATNDAVWDWDLVTNELYWGEGFKNMFGYDIENKYVDISAWSDHIHPDELKSVVESINKSIEDPSQKQWQFEYRYIKSNGAYADVLDKGYIIRNDAGIAIRMVGAMQDLTERKQDLKKLQTSDENYKILFTNNPVPMWAYTKSHKLTMVNEAALELLGYSKSEFLSLSLFDLRHEDEHQRFAEIIQDKNHFIEEKLFNEWQYIKKNGTSLFVEVASHLIEINGESVRVVAVNDITESKRAKQAIVEQNERLREISQINSHEMRRPVASILGIVTLFDVADLNNEYNKELIELLKTTAEELDDVIHVINSKASQMSHITK